MAWGGGVLVNGDQRDGEFLSIAIREGGMMAQG
jgi:hypothetical protein